MYENSLELAENKLLMLYILKSIKDPISNAQFTEIILENNFMNYFIFQQYLSELEESKFVEYHENNNKKLLVITEKGDSVLSLFKDRLSPSKITIINEYVKEKWESIKRELTIQADYTIASNDSFIVDLKAVESESLLMELKLTVPSKEPPIYSVSLYFTIPLGIPFILHLFSSVKVFRFIILIYSSQKFDN